ncbi:nucleoside-diphosphate sugar epimerase [Enemella evansiae]|uniref:NAD(P)H-binding protein n=1 Tax=Enemella evansiae TaxID=2016499 RepID=UPI000B970DF0|nr:NAD(P)H-binding protein [Enemella evansiae]OYN98280.1 nucleoside-diphosphate sugar epimerase [Enemella evansiae]
MSRSVFVTGARGKTGREVIAQLGQRADAMVRGGSSLDPTAVADVVRFSWDDRSTWGRAVEGMDAIYLMRPDVPDAPDLITHLVALTPGSHIVLLSEQGAHTLAADEWVRQVELAVTSGAGSWTILRPSWFQQVLIDPRYFLPTIAEERMISLPTGGAPIAWIDTRDIAAVAVQALVEPDLHHGKAYTLTGPEGVTLASLAEDISSAIGDHVRPFDPPLEDALSGADRWTREVVGGMFGRVREGIFAEVTTTVEEVTGQLPRGIGRFIAENQASWAGQATAPSDTQMGRTR